MLTVVVLSIKVAGTAVLYAIFDLPLGAAVLAMFVGWPLVGTLATMDDDWLGGWSNPDGSERPEWLQAPYWGDILCGLALVWVGFAVDSGWRSDVSVRYWLLALVTAFLGAGLLVRRWWIAMGSAVVLVGLYILEAT